MTTTGLGWPMTTEKPATEPTLGWPTTTPAPATTPAAPAAAPARSTEPAEPAEPPAPPTAGADEPAGGLSTDLPMAAAIREELSAATRETTAPAHPDQVSRETSAGPVSRETAATEPAAAVVSRETSATAERWPAPATPRVLGVANQKGGVGKTTSTVNLAASLAQHGARVLVVDLDPQGNASTAFGLDHRTGVPGTYGVLVDGAAIDDVAVPVPDLPGLFCVPATIDLAGAEIELVSVVARESRLTKALHAVTQPYDYVFIDCPPSLGLLTINALVAAREVLIPIQCEFYALEGLSQLLRNIELVRAHLNPALHVSTILLTMYDGRTRLAEQVAEEVRNHFGGLVLGATIPRSVRISEAPGYGQTVMTYDPASRGAVAYVDAAREIAGRTGEETTGSVPASDGAGGGAERSAQ